MNNLVSDSTSSVLLKVTNDFYLACDQSKINVLLLLDFSKAFDSVPYELLLEKLHIYFNFSTSAVLLIKKYLRVRLQAVLYASKWSSFIRVASGVPQGSILGRLLFFFLSISIH